MRSTSSFVVLCVCLLCVWPAYGGYQFQKITSQWVETMPGVDPVLNNQGQVLCLGGEWSHLWLFDDNGLTRIGGGPISGFYAFDMNDDGVVAYNWFGGPASDTFLTRYSAGVYQTLASTAGPTIMQVSGAAINNAGAVATSLVIEDSASATWWAGLYLIDPANQVTPWFNPELNPFGEWGFGRLSLADTPATAFSNEYGAYLSPAPDSYIPTAQQDAYGWSWPQASTVNSAGQVGYIVWTGEDYPPTPVLIVADAQTTPTQRALPFTWIENLAINDGGDVAYYAADDETSIAGIFINDDPLPVIAVGDEIEGSLVMWLTMCGRGFNDAGQILFWAELEDGSSGLYLATPAAGLPGDFNGDGLANTEDINAFILALTDGDAFAAAFPLVALSAADPSGDGLINTEDISAFIALLTGGGDGLLYYTSDINSLVTWLNGWDGGGPGLPEPGSAAVMLLLAAGALCRRGGRCVRA